MDWKNILQKRINTTLYIGINVRDMHITMRVACRIARACTREVATSVFTLAGLIVSAVAHAPCAVAFCSDAIQVIDSSTRIYGRKMEKNRLVGRCVMLILLRTPDLRNLPVARSRQTSGCFPVATAQKIVKRSMDFDDRFLLNAMLLTNLITLCFQWTFNWLN